VAGQLSVNVWKKARDGLLIDWFVIKLTYCRSIMAATLTPLLIVDAKASQFNSMCQLYLCQFIREINRLSTKRIRKY